eukprot:gene8429-biopygen21153
MVGKGFPSLGGQSRSLVLHARIGACRSDGGDAASAPPVHSTAPRQGKQPDDADEERHLPLRSGVTEHWHGRGAGVARTISDFGAQKAVQFQSKQALAARACHVTPGTGTFSGGGSSSSSLVVVMVVAAAAATVAVVLLPWENGSGRGSGAGRTTGFKGTDADRTRAVPFLPGDGNGGGGGGVMAAAAQAAVGPVPKSAGG